MSRESADEERESEDEKAFEGGSVGGLSWPWSVSSEARRNTAAQAREEMRRREGAMLNITFQNDLVRGRDRPIGRIIAQMAKNG